MVACKNKLGMGCSMILSGQLCVGLEVCEVV